MSVPPTPLRSPPTAGRRPTRSAGSLRSGQPGVRQATNPTPLAALVRLQTLAGNQAVARLVGHAVQRARTTAGWEGADTRGVGWNAGAKDEVEGFKVRRIPVDDIPVGNQQDFSGTAPSARPPTSPATSGTVAAPGSAVITVGFGKRARQDVVAPSSIEVVKDVLRAAGLAKATITSTARTPADQARAMYQNLVGSGRGQGVEHQRQLYGTAGDKIIDVFVELRDKGSTPAEIQAGMRDRILEIGPGKVSRHLADPATLNVLDIAPSSLGGGDAVAAFETAAKALVGSRIERLLTPGDRDPAEHLEIKPLDGSPATADETSSPAPAQVSSGTRVPAAPAPAPSTVPTPRSVPTSGFIHDVDRTTWELLPKARREYFESIEWNDLDFPKAKDPVKDTSPANLDKLRSTPAYVLFKTVKKKKEVEVETWFIKGAHQDDAAALFLALAKLRPGGGERRVNTGPTAILTEAQYGKNPDKFDEYIKSQLRDPEGEKKAGTRKMLNQYAASEFERMREAAAKDGVVLSIRNAFRERKKARASATAKDNPAAVASYSAHSLGLAMDLNLKVKGMMGAKEVTTKMTNTIKLMGAPAYKWVFQHGADFGYYQYRAEPWHWEYNPPSFAEKFWAEAPDLTPEPAEPPKSKRKSKR